MKIPPGIPFVKDYLSLIASEDYRTIETFSDLFLERHKAVFREYARKWLFDPFHTYNRQWEYPYVYQQIKGHLGSRQPGKVDILDAGSGVTFFPYFVRETFKDAFVTCCDRDPGLQRLFERVKGDQDRIAFRVEDLRSFKLSDNSFDIIYCISVLEHTDRYEGIVKEFKRILRPGGILIITFDVSLKGKEDIPPEKAERLLGILSDYFQPADKGDSQAMGTAVRADGILTTDYIKGYKKELLPWKHPFLSLMKSALMRGYVPMGLMKSLTFYCATFRKDA